MVRKGYYVNLTKIKQGLQGRFIAAKVTTDNSFSFCICNIYAPNDDNPSFFDALDQNLADFNEHKLIVGDFNLVMNQKLDRYRTNGTSTSRAVSQLKKIMETSHMVDVWRIRNEDRMEFSWKRNNPRLQASRIDLAIATRGLDQFITNCFYFHGVMSDHRPLYINLEGKNNERGPGYWKFNASHLHSKQFLEDLKINLEKDIRATESMQPVKRWTHIKARLIKTLQSLSRSRTSEDKFIMGELVEHLSEMDTRLPLNQRDQEIYNRTEIELDEMAKKRAEKLIFRSQARWYELGERSTKYFYNLEKCKFNAKTCHKLLINNTQEIDDPKTILQHQQQYYQQLYAKDEQVHFDLVNASGIGLTEEMANELNRPFSDKEIAQAVLAMSNGKSPGPDGLPIEVYKVCWPQLNRILIKAIDKCCEHSQLYSDAKRGILNLIPKANKDTRILANLRPITLLNSDYKIIEKTVARRMDRVLPSIIHHDQKGFMANRRISSNIRKLFDLITLCEKEKIPAFTLSLDFKKCFDYISFDVIIGSLSYFRFPKYMIDCIRMLYDDFNVKVQNNGFLSEDISIQRSVHQGGCCSSHIFLCCAELMAIELRKNRDIKGINIAEIIYLLNQFADDTDVTSLHDQKSLDAITSELELFRLQSGFTISYDKTKILRMGSMARSDAMLYTQSPIAWTNDSINVLGINVSTSADVIMKNYDSSVQKVTVTLQQWENRSLSLIGKVNVINTLISSLFIYKMTVLPNMPENLLTHIEKLFTDFLWNKHKPKIPLRILKLNRLSGGLGLTDLRKRQDSINCTWLKILSEDEKTAHLCYHICDSDLGQDLWRCNLNVKDVKCMVSVEKSQFWHEVFVSWAKYNYKPPSDTTSQFLWFNSNIRVDSKPFIWKKYYTKGLRWVSQLFTSSAQKSYQHLNEEFQMSVMDFNSLISALPKEWRSLTMSAFSNKSPFDTLLATGNISRTIYQRLTCDRTGLHAKMERWESIVGQISVDEFYAQFAQIYVTTNVPKLRSFQYRLLHFALIFNAHLYRWGIIDDNVCNLCNQAKETLEHALYECPEISHIWRAVVDIIEELFNITIILSVKNVLWMVHQPVVNFVILLAKQYLYSKRCKGTRPIVREFRLTITRTKSIEKFIATKNSTLHKHISKWHCVDNVIDLNEYVEEYVNTV